MSERDRLQALADRTGLLAMRATRAEMLATAHQFILLAARELAGDGWRNLRALPPKENVHGIRVDKLIHERTLQIVDVIVNGDAPDGPLRRVSWDDKGTGDREDVMPAPAPEPGNGEPGNGEPGNGEPSEPAPWTKIEQELGAIAAAQEDQANGLRELVRVLDEIRKNGIVLKWR